MNKAFLQPGQKQWQQGPRDKAEKKNNGKENEESEQEPDTEAEDYEDTYGDLENGHEDISNPEIGPDKEIF